MADTGKTMVMFGVLGVGGYLAYEYYQYSSAMNTAAGGDPNNLAALEGALPFFTYLLLQWGQTGSATAQQVQIYSGLQSILSGAAGAAPGTTPASTGTPTSISTAPTSTATTNASSAPTSTSALQQLQAGKPVTSPIFRQPISTAIEIRGGGLQVASMATQLQTAINKTTANADQWNYGFKQITGQDISSYYGFNFDTVYGVVPGRSSVMLTAMAFLNKAQAAKTKTPTVPPGSTPLTTVPQRSSGHKGFGAIASYPLPALSSAGNLLTLAHHPWPYVPSYHMSRGLGGYGSLGLGAPVIATGFEKALFAGQPLRSSRVL